MEINVTFTLDDTLLRSISADNRRSADINDAVAWALLTLSQGRQATVKKASDARDCAECGVIYIIKPKARREGVRFCSTKCRSAAYRKTLVLEPQN